MDKAKKLYEAGRLQEAIENLKQEVKASPTDVGMRSFLFALLCFNGDYEGGMKQLDVISLQSASAEAGAQVYRNVLEAERSRSQFFHNGQTPHYLINPPTYVKIHLDVIKTLKMNQMEKVKSFLNESAQKLTPLKGNIDGKSFKEFLESNDIIAPILELIIHDQYIWLPFEQIKQLQIEKPKKLEDLLWISARFELKDGQVFGGYIPTRYVGTHEHTNDQVRLGRMTDWKPIDDEFFHASGQRMFFVDGEAVPLLEVREINFDA